MKEILIQALGFLLIIFAAFFCKKAGLLKKEDGTVLSKIIVNITLPATIIVSLAGMKLSVVFFCLIGIGFFLNIILALVGGFISKKDAPLNRAFMMYCISGYNIGNFTLPYIQGFLPAAVPALCMFDIGNSIMIAGGTTSLVDTVSGIQDEKPSVKQIFLKLGHSIPFMTYLILIILKVIHLELPTEALTIFGLFAKANGFLSLFMIGLYLDLSLSKEAFRFLKKILFWRYTLGIIAGILFYLFSPFSRIITITLVVLCLAPVPTFAVINSVEAGVPHEETGFVSSISILISLALMTIALLILL